jgi:hypothetical protein
MRHADTVGVAPVTPEIDFARVMDHVWGAIRTIEPHPAGRQRAARPARSDVPSAAPGSEEAATLVPVGALTW